MAGTALGRGLRIALVAVAAYYAIWGGEYSAIDLVRLAELQARESAARDETLLVVDSLRELVTRLEVDPVTWERIARERFGMVREGETLYRFVSVAPPGESAIHVATSP